MTVTFCGHRQVYDHDNVKSWLTQCIQAFIDEGADCFYVGNYGAFDRMAAWTLGSFKKKYPYIRIVLVLAYRAQEHDEYLYDEVVFPLFDNKPRKYNIIRCNQWMVRQSDAIIAYVLYTWGGAAQTLEYALTKKRRIRQYPDDTDLVTEQEP